MIWGNNMYRSPKLDVVYPFDRACSPQGDPVFLSSGRSQTYWKCVLFSPTSLRNYHDSKQWLADI